MILAASSPFFKKVLKKVPHNHPLIYLKGVKFSSLEAVLSFVYCGEVSLSEADLEDFLAVAQELEVTGLVPNEANSNPPPSSQTEQENSTSLNNNGVMKSEDTIPASEEEEQQQQSCFKNNWVWAASENDSAVKREPEDPSNVVKSKFCSVFNQYIITDSEGQSKCSFCGHVSNALRKSEQRRKLRGHVESKHLPGLLQYNCKDCGEQFVTKAKHEDHLYRMGCRGRNRI